MTAIKMFAGYTSIYGSHLLVEFAEVEPPVRNTLSSGLPKFGIENNNSLMPDC